MERSIITTFIDVDGNLHTSERIIKNINRENAVRNIGDIDTERERQRVKSVKRNIERAFMSLPSARYFFTFTDSALCYDPRKFLNEVADYLKKRNVNFVILAEIYHRAHYGYWFFDKKTNKKEWRFAFGKDYVYEKYIDDNTREEKIIKYEPLVTEETLARNDFHNDGIHIHGICDIKFDFEDWIKNHKNTCIENDLYIQEIYSLKKDKNGNYKKNIEACFEYCSKNLIYTKKWIEVMGLNTKEDGSHFNLQLYKCNVKRFNLEKHKFIKNEDGSIVSINNYSSVEIELLKDKNNREYSEHVKKQQMYEQLFSFDSVLCNGNEVLSVSDSKLLPSVYPFINKKWRSRIKKNISKRINLQKFTHKKRQKSRCKPGRTEKRVKNCKISHKITRKRE